MYSRNSGKRFAAILTVALLVGALDARAEQMPLEAMPRDLEVQYALSALPARLREAATVYRLDPAAGYKVEQQGTNGMACLVERTDWPRMDLRNDVYVPICWDSVGAQNHMRVSIDVAAMRAQGRSAEWIKQEVERRFKNKIYKAPDRGGLSYMLAPIMRTYPSPDLKDKHVMTMAAPHLMPYAPNVSAAAIGSDQTLASVAQALDEDPHAYLIVSVGAQERKQILADNAALLKQLCEYRTFLCLKPRPESTG